MIQVWRCDLDRGIASPNVLDEKERDRAGRFAFEHLRRRYVAAHTFMRSVLGSTLGLEPAALQFDTTAEGKPFLLEQDLAFNLSHAHSIAYLILGGSEPLGIDVELHHELDDLMGVARTVFSPTEVAELEHANPSQRAELFLLCWTRKEAYVKALGVGLGARLCDITVNPSRADVVVPPSAEVCPIPFHIRTIESPSDEYVAIATVNAPQSVTLRDFHLT